MSEQTVTLRLTANAQGVVTGIKQVTGALDGISKSAGAAGVASSRGLNTASEAAANLSSQFARLRSNAVIAGAAIAAVAAVRSFVSGITSASSALEGYRQGLTAAAGSQQGAAAAMAFVRAESERLGTDLRVSAQAYTSLAAAAKGTALEGQATRDVFSAVSEAARVLNLSADQTSGALQALQQMVSKGTVQAEELRGQLGERLPGAFGLAARAMGKTTAELGKMLEQGQVTAEELLPKLAAELRKTFGAQAADAANTPAAEMQRLSNAVFELQAAIGNAGFMQALASGAQTLAAQLTALVQSGSLDTLVTGIAAIGAAALLAFGGRTLGAIGAYIDAQRRAIISASIVTEVNQSLAATALESAQAKSIELTESLRVIEAARAEIIAKQRLAASDVAVAEAALTAASANSQGSFALKVQREATEQLIVAKARLTGISTELAALGASQAITQQNLARSAAAQVAAQGTLNSTLAQGGVVMQGLRAAGSRLFAIIGGWPTIALAAGVGLYQLWDAVREGRAAARAPITALEELNAQLEKRVELARLISSGQANASNASEVLVLEEAKNKALELTQQLERARQQLDQLQAGGGGDRVLSALITGQRNAIASLEEDLADSEKAVRKNAEVVAKLAQASGTGAKSVEELDQKMRDLIDTLASERAATNAAKEAQQQANKAKEEAVRATERLRDIQESTRQAGLDDLKAIRAADVGVRDFLQSLSDEVDAIGLTEEARRRNNILLELETKLRSGNIDEVKAQQYRDEAEALIARGNAAQFAAEEDQRLADTAAQTAEEYRSVWRNATDSVSRAFGDLATGGIKSFKDFGRALKDILRQTLSDLLAMIVRSNITKALGGLIPGKAGASSGQAPIPGISGDLSLGTLFGDAGTRLGGSIGSSLFGPGGAQIGGILGGAAQSAAIGSMIGGLFGGAGSTGGAIGGAIGSAIAGPIGAAIGSVLGGAVGSFFGKFKTVSSGVDFTIGDNGATGSTFQNQKKGGVFGKKKRTITSALDSEAQQAIDDLFAQLTQSLAEAAKTLGVAVPPLVSGSFRQEFDKKGSLKKEFSTIAGRVYNESQQAFAQRLQAENIISLVDSALNLDSLGTAQNEASQIAERWRGSAENLLAGAQFLLLATTDLRNGFNLLGDATLTDITALVEDLAKAGEPLAQAYARVSVSTQLLEQALDLSGVVLSKTRDEFVRFAVDIADAAGGLDRAQALWSDYFTRFFSDTERAQLALNNALSNAAAQFTDINLDAAAFTGAGGTEEFRVLFEQALPTLSAEAVVEWLEAANALGLVLDATTALTDSLDATATAAEEAAAALAEQLVGYMDNIASQARDAADALADFGLAPLAAGLQQIARETERATAEALALGASEEQLAQVRNVGAQQAELLRRQAAAELADLLTGVNTALFEIDASPLETELARIQAAMQNTLVQASALGASEEQLALIRQLGAAQAAAAQASAQAALDAAAQQAADALAQQRAQLADLIGGVNTALFEIDASPLETELARIQAAMQNTLVQASALGASEEQLALIRQLGAAQAAAAQASAQAALDAAAQQAADALAQQRAQLADLIGGVNTALFELDASPLETELARIQSAMQNTLLQASALGASEEQLALIRQLGARQAAQAQAAAAEQAAAIIAAEADKLRSAFAQIADAISGLRARIADDVQSLRAAAPGFNAAAFAAQRITALRAQLAAGGDAQTQLGLIEQIRGATLDRFAAEQEQLNTLGQLQEQQASDAARRADEQLRAAETAHNEAMQSWQAQQQAAQRLRGFVDNLGLSNVSPLTAIQRFDEAKALFEQAKANGDAEALQSTAQAFLEETRNVFGVSDKAVSIFNDVRGTLGNRANQLASSSAPVFQAPALEDELSSTTGAVIDTRAGIERLRSAAITELQGLDGLLAGLRTQEQSSLDQSLSALTTQTAQAAAQHTELVTTISQTSTAAVVAQSVQAAVQTELVTAAVQTAAQVSDTLETARHESRLAVLREQRGTLEELLAEQRAGRIEQRADGNPRILPIRSTDAASGADGITFEQAYLDKFLTDGIIGNGGLQEAGQARRANPGTGPVREIQPIEVISDGIQQFVDGQVVTTGFLREQERRLIELIAAQKEMGERIQRTMEAVIRSGVRP